MGGWVKLRATVTDMYKIQLNLFWSTGLKVMSGLWKFKEGIMAGIAQAMTKNYYFDTRGWF